MFKSTLIRRAERELVLQFRRLRLEQHQVRSTVTSLQDTEQPSPSPLESALPFSEMPGPKSLPFIGARWLHLPGGPLYGMTFYKKTCKMREMYGDIIREEVVPGIFLVHVFKPDDFETVYRNDGKYPIRDSFFMIQRYNKKYNNGIHGIIDSQGEKWYRLRSQVQRKMMKPKAVTAYFDEQAAVADDFVTTLQINRDKDCVIDDLMPYMYKFALESIGIVCFNKRIGALDSNAGPNSEAGQFIQAVNDVLRATHSELRSLFLFMYFDTPMFKRLVRAQHLIRRVSLRHAQDSLRRLLEKSTSGEEIDGEHGDLIPYMMTKTDFTEEEINTVIAEFFFAGVDTTSHMLGFTLYNVCRSPHALERLREEINLTLPNRRPPTHHDVAKMSYLRAVLRESLRILPVAPGNGRTVSHDIVLSGYVIPKGTIVGLHHDILGHEEQHFSDAGQFKPERWLRSETNKNTTHPFIMMPFGFGARGCVGRRFAEQEVAIAMIKLLQAFDFEYCHTTDLKYEMNLVNAPTTPLHFRVTDRK